MILYSRLLAIRQNPDHRRLVDGGGIVDNYIDEKMEAPHRGCLRRQFQY